MKKSRWTDYEKYLVLSDNSGARLHGTYMNFQDFKRVVEVVTSMAKSQRQNVHLRDGEIVSLEGKGITTNDANTILTNIYECNWTSVTEKLLIVASTMKVII